MRSFPEGSACCNTALRRARHRCNLGKLHAAHGVLPRCCGNLDENWLAFTLEFCIIFGSKFELLLAPLVFQALQMPAMGTEEWRELQRPGMEGQQHPGRPGGDRRPNLPTPRRELRSGGLPDEAVPLLGPSAEFEAPSLGPKAQAVSVDCVSVWSFYSEFTYSKHNKSPEHEP